MKIITEKDLEPYSELFRRSRADYSEQLKALEHRTEVQRRHRAHERAAWSKLLNEGHAPVKQILALCKEQERRVIEFRDATMRDLLTIPPAVAAAWDAHVAAIDAGLLVMQSEPPTPRDPNVFYLMPEVIPAVGGACGVVRGEPRGTLHPYQAAVGSGWGWDGDDEQ